MKTRITMKIRIIPLHCPLPLGIKQAQASEFLQLLYWHLFSQWWASLAVPPPASAENLSLPFPSATLQLQPPSLGSCWPPHHLSHWPSAHRIWASGLWHLVKTPGKMGFAASVALCLHIPPLLLEAPPDHTCWRLYSWENLCIPQRREHPPPSRVSTAIPPDGSPHGASSAWCFVKGRSLQAQLHPCSSIIANREELDQADLIVSCNPWWLVCITEITRSQCQLQDSVVILSANSLRGITSQMRETGVYVEYRNEPASDT